MRWMPAFLIAAFAFLALSEVAAAQEKGCWSVGGGSYRCAPGCEITGCYDIFTAREGIKQHCDYRCKKTKAAEPQPLFRLGTPQPSTPQPAPVVVPTPPPRLPIAEQIAAERRQGNGIFDPNDPKSATFENIFAFGPRLFIYLGVFSLFAVFVGLMWFGQFDRAEEERTENRKRLLVYLGLTAAGMFVFRPFSGADAMHLAGGGFGPAMWDWLAPRGSSGIGAIVQTLWAAVLTLVGLAIGLAATIALVVGWPWATYNLLKHHTIDVYKGWVYLTTHHPLEAPLARAISEGRALTQIELQQVQRDIQAAASNVWKSMVVGIHTPLVRRRAEKEYRHSIMNDQLREIIDELARQHAEALRMAASEAEKRVKTVLK